jgi:chromosome segregation ATPase
VDRARPTSENGDTIAGVSSLPDLEARVAALEADRADYRAVLVSVGALSGRVDGLNERVDGLTERFDGLNNRVDGLTERFDGLNERVDGLTERFDGLTEQVQTVEIKTDANREAINALGEKLAGFQNETRARFEALEHKSDSRYHEANRRFNSVDEQLAEIKDLIIDRRSGR